MTHLDKWLQNDPPRELQRLILIFYDYVKEMNVLIAIVKGPWGQWAVEFGEIPFLFA